MEAMAKSVWDTGTYELLISKDPEGEPGDLMVVVFARPMDREADPASDEDAPILAHVDVFRSEYDRDLDEFHYGLRSVGEKGLLRPEDVPAVFGDKLGLRVLIALWQATDRDFRGMDMDHVPWRTPSNGAFPLMRRTYTVMMAVKERLGM